ncbi:MAG TPA: hypothetical protein ENK18_22555 [Deltaproteobacteria bacterium]|nr:hypothetical protein [Deltaproteobacteria bacterium]
MEPRAVFNVISSALVGAALTGLALRWLGGEPPEPPPEPPQPRPRVSDPTVVLHDPLPDRPAAPRGAPNLVLVIGCTLRKDQTSVYGGPAVTTPFLKELSEQGTHFADMVNAAPWTRAASTAILTGHHPISLGMVDPGPARSEQRLPEQVVTLAEHLQAHGWATAGLTTNPNLNAIYGFDQGFDAYRQLEHLWRQRNIKLPGTLAVPWALELLDGLEPGRPVFLQLVLVDAHLPFKAPDPLMEAVADPSVPELVVGYRAVLRRLDDAVAQLAEALEQRGMDRDNTVFVVVNDHGEGLDWPRHHGRSHGRYLAPSAVGGVVVLRGPKVAVGHTVEGLASQIDLLPTLSSLLGIEPPEGPGHDWSAQVRGAQQGTSRGEVYTDTWFRDVDRAAIYTDALACQLEFSEPRPDSGPGFVTGCFDRRLDPLHAEPLVGDPPPGEALMQRLRQWRIERAAEGASVGGGELVEPSAALNQQLEALGYLEGPEPEPGAPDRD